MDLNIRCASRRAPFESMLGQDTMRVVGENKAKRWREDGREMGGRARERATQDHDGYTGVGPGPPAVAPCVGPDGLPNPHHGTIKRRLPLLCVSHFFVVDGMGSQ